MLSKTTRFNCKHYTGFKYRHYHVWNIQYDVFWWVGVQVKKEAPVNFFTNPTEGRSTLHPTDILVYNWSEIRHAYVDIKGASPMVSLIMGSLKQASQASNSEAATAKEKRSEACKVNQHGFIPFAFDTFGFLAPEAVELLKRVQKVMDNNVIIVGSNEIVLRRINFSIHKGHASQFVACLSSTSMQLFEFINKILSFKKMKIHLKLHQHPKQFPFCSL